MGLELETLNPKPRVSGLGEISLAAWCPNRARLSVTLTPTLLALNPRHSKVLPSQTLDLKSRNPEP